MNNKITIPVFYGESEYPISVKNGMIWKYGMIVGRAIFSRFEEINGNSKYKLGILRLGEKKDF